MVIYIDLLILLNFIFDYLILLTTAIVLRRKINKLKIFLASLIGEISIIFLIFNLNYIIIIISKIMIAILLNIISFNYKDIKYTFNNLIYFYMLSIILAGFIYFFKVNNINYFFSLLIGPFILYIYYYQNKRIKTNYKNYYNINIVFKNNKNINCIGYLDTGNKLIDPISNKPVILLDKRLCKGVIQIRTPIYVPYNVLNNHGLLSCINPKYVEIDNKIVEKVLIGIMDNNINIDGVDCILNTKILEG